MRISASGLVNYTQLVVINLILFLDLYLAMVNPFYPRNSRLKFYLVVLVILIVVSLRIVYSYDFSNEPYFGEDDPGMLRDYH